MTRKVKEIAALLEDNGWRLARIKGDHRVYTREGARRPIILPGNLNDDVAIGTLNSILRAANLK